MPRHHVLTIPAVQHYSSKHKEKDTTHHGSTCFIQPLVGYESSTSLDRPIDNNQCWQHPCNSAISSPTAVFPQLERSLLSPTIDYQSSVISSTNTDLTSAGNFFARSSQICAPAIETFQNPYSEQEQFHRFPGNPSTLPFTEIVEPSLNHHFHDAQHFDVNSGEYTMSPLRPVSNHLLMTQDNGYSPLVGPSTSHQHQPFTCTVPTTNLLLSASNSSPSIGSLNSSTSVTTATTSTRASIQPTRQHQSTPAAVSTSRQHQSTSAAVGTPVCANNTWVPEVCDTALQQEEERCRKFLADTCGCKLGVKNRPCSSQFKVEYLLEVRAQASLLTREQLDMVILGGVMAGMNKGDDIYHGRHKPAKRQRIYTEHIHNGHAVCAVTFGFLHGIGQKFRLAAIQKHYAENGMTVRVHKNTGRLPANALTHDQQLNIVKFLENYAEANAILLPGRIPGYKRDDLKMLPSSCSKKVSTQSNHTVSYQRITHTRHKHKW